MKTKTPILLTLLLAILFSTKTSYAQGNIIIGGSVALSLPAGATSFDDKDHLNFLKEAFGPEFSKQYFLSHQSYKVKDVIYRFDLPNKGFGAKTIRKRAISSNYLKEVSDIWSRTYNKPTNTHLYKKYSNKTMTVNGNKILLGSYQDKNNSWNYRFVFLAPSIKRTFSGEITALTPDVQLDPKMLDTLFKSIEFKE